ncbi:DUF692 domain-containing protein [Methylolobus aquaticus]|nr:DUF692 domain-containing protein [Methylolobus aquaticus]
MNTPCLDGAGLGLRREHLFPLEAAVPPAIDFFEVSPENWLAVGGRLGRAFRTLTERHRFVAHGLALSLGGPAPLDEAFLVRMKRFLDLHGMVLYTEHLSYCSDEGHLYDLFPIPFTPEAVNYVAARIRRTQEILERPIAVENSSYYLQSPDADMDEASFIAAVLDEADCGFHLDVNNVYVNSVNYGYDPEDFLRRMPGQRIVYVHVAGHDREDDDLIIDTHGQAVIDPVWALLESAYRRFGVRPTLLERDFNLPLLDELVREVEHIARLQRRWQPSAWKRSA